ncbi:hypothetical protein [Haloferula sp.]|uniref:thrombospondin type 3 repeat-containing protein n=1 Tax=Haloferula sp. TaxID=2497595 RepID=UPI003C750231
MKKQIPTCLVAAVLTLPLTSHAETYATDFFSCKTLLDGSGDWLNNWQSSGVSGVITTSTSTSSLAVTREATAVNNAQAINRRYAGDLIDPVQISFDFTINEFPTAGGNAAQDRFELYGGSAAAGGTTTTNSWMFFGGQDLTGLDAGLAGGNWAFHNGTGGGNFENGVGGENSLIDSGIALVLGATYRFTILTDPANGTYVVSVDNLDDAAAGFTSGTLGYRGAASVNPHLQFGTRLSDIGDTAGFTVDNIVISSPSADSDSDGMDDSWEQFYGLNVGINDAAIDNDNVGGPDGRTNIQEYEGADGIPFNGDETDPQLADTDGDSLSDGDEITIHLTSPLCADIDGDLYDDAAEVAALTDALDPLSFPIPAGGLFIDFSSNGTGSQEGPFQDPAYSRFVANHEVDSSNVLTGQLIVDRSESYSVPAFTGSPTVTLGVAFPDSTDNRVKQLIGRNDGFTANYQGEHANLMRDWIGIDARAASGGNGPGVDTTMAFTLSGLPAGIYQYRGYHHDIANVQAAFAISVNADGVTDVPIGAFRMTHSSDNGLSPASNPGSGNQPSDLPSTIEFLFSANGTDDVVISYVVQEQASGVLNSLLGINGIEVTTAVDSDGDGIPDASDLNPGVSDTGLSSDADSLTDLEEFHLGTLLNNPDSDNDGLNDDVETNTGAFVSPSDTGTSPWVADWDADGFDDGAEVNSGTDPTDPLSFPPFLARVVSVDLIGKTITLEWNSASGVTYNIYGSNDLLGDVQTTWDLEASDLTAGGATTQEVINLPDPVPAKRFFSVVESTP